MHGVFKATDDNVSHHKALDSKEIFEIVNMQRTFQTVETT